MTAGRRPFLDEKGCETVCNPEPTTVTRGEIVMLSLAVALVFIVGLPYLDVPSLWHDELVHICVAKNVVEEGRLALPGGAFYPSAAAYSLLLTPVIAVFGDGPIAMRAPSVVAQAITVLLTYLLARRFLGRPTALIAAFALALNPWSVAWSREARFYALQAALAVASLSCAWRAMHVEERRAAWFAAGAATLSYVACVFTSYHAILLLAPVGLYAGLRLVFQWRTWSRWSCATAACVVLGTLTIVWLLVNPNPVDRAAVFETGLGGRLLDPQRTVRIYYLRWLYENLSLGYFLVAMLGFTLFLTRGWRGVFLFLAFWAPMLILTFFIGYRRPRFMFFVFPFYVIAVSYGLVRLTTLLRTALRACRARQWQYVPPALLILAFGARLGLSTVRLVEDTLNTTAGAHATLAARHPQWEKPCAYVREHRTHETVLSTTYLPALYYVGHVDNWFPNRYTAWEYQESGLKGLAGLDELRTFLHEHPQGYFLAEFARFGLYADHSQLKDLKNECEWVERHMRRVPEASSEDVTLYVWDFREIDPRILP